MRNHSLYIRVFQTLTVATLFGLVAFVSLKSGVFENAPDADVRGAPNGITTESAQTNQPKIQRPRETKNATFQEWMSDGDKKVYRNDMAGAREAYQKAAQLEPKEALPYEKIGDTAFLQHQYGDAFNNFALASSLKPQQVNLRIKIVRSLIGQRKVADAETALEMIQPETAESVYYQGLTAAFFNDANKADERLKKSMTMTTDSGLRENAQKILTVYRDYGLARDAKSEYLQTLLAQAFDQIGEYGLAIELAFDAIKTMPDYRDAWIVLGHAFLSEERWFDAEDALTKAIALDAGHPAPFLYRGITRRKLQKSAVAEADFKQADALGWRPRIIVESELADLYFDRADFTQAFPLYKKIAITDPSDINRFVRPMALAINHLNLPHEATALAEAAQAAHPNTAMAYNLTGWAALANNNLGSARQNLGEALKRDRDLPEAYFNLGRVFEAEGKFTDALKNYKTAAELSEKRGNTAIGNAASLRYNDLVDTEPINTPQVESVREAPSLSLE